MRFGLDLIRLNSDWWKTWVHERIRWPATEPGAWFLHEQVDEGYCRQIVSEARTKVAEWAAGLGPEQPRELCARCGSDERCGWLDAGGSSYRRSWSTAGSATAHIVGTGAVSDAGTETGHRQPFVDFARRFNHPRG